MAAKSKTKPPTKSPISSTTEVDGYFGSEANKKGHTAKTKRKNRAKKKGYVHN